jgi:hypothetical protein
MKNWGKITDVNWDICATWHVPLEMKRESFGWDDRRHEVEMRKYFNTLDRRIYKAHTKNVALEWCVGWWWKATQAR